MKTKTKVLMKSLKEGFPTNTESEIQKHSDLDWNNGCGTQQYMAFSLGLCLQMIFQECVEKEEKG